MHKNIVKSYKGIGFTINIETNLQVADALILHSTSRDFSTHRNIITKKLPYSRYTDFEANIDQKKRKL